MPDKEQTSPKTPVHRSEAGRDEQQVRAALIGWLSKEIETHTVARTTWRSRISFTVYFGPFVLLGALVIATGGNTPTLKFTWDIQVAVAVFVAVFLLLGDACARVEEHMWAQCNQWRKAIHRVCFSTWTEQDVVFDQKLRRAYLRVFGLLAFSFGVLIYILTQLEPTSP